MPFWALSLPVYHAVFNPVYMIARLDGSKSVSDDDHGLLTVKTVNGIHDRALSIIIKRRCGFIEYKYLRIPEQRPGYADTLPLSSG